MQFIQNDSGEEDEEVVEEDTVELQIAKLEVSFCILSIDFNHTGFGP